MPLPCCDNGQSPLAKLGLAALKLGHTFKQINDSCWTTAAASCEISPAGNLKLHNKGRPEAESGRPLG
jgi:hypothetical protein